MNKRKYLFVLILIASFFAMVKPVNAEEKKVYWSLGDFRNLYDDGIKHIIFDDISKSNRIITDYDAVYDVSADSINSTHKYCYYMDCGPTAETALGTVMIYIVGDTVYIQFDGTLYLNTDSHALFYNLSEIETIEGFEYVNTSNVGRMDYMFYNCSSLKELDLSSFDTSNLVATYSMFEGCSSLENVNLDGWDTSKVRDFSNMFEGCLSLIELDLSSFTVNKYMSSAYRMLYNTPKLSYLDISNFDVMNSNYASQNSSTAGYLSFSTSLANVVDGPFYDGYRPTPGIYIRSFKISGLINESTDNKITIFYRFYNQDIALYQMSDLDISSDNYPDEYKNGYYISGWYTRRVLDSDTNKYVYSGLINSYVKINKENFDISGNDEIVLYPKYEQFNPNLLEANTVSFKDNLSLNFLAELSSGHLEGTYVKFKYNHYGENIEVIVPINVNDKNGKYYRFRCPLTASEMMIPVTAELYLKDSTEPVSTYTRSIREYIISGLANSTDDKEKELFRATLNYGGYTQKRFNYNGSPFAYDDYKDDISNINVSSKINFDRPEGHIDGIKYVGSSVFFRNAPYVRYYFELENGDNINDYTFKIGNNVIEPTKKDNRYYIESAPALAYQLDDEQNITVTKDNSDIMNFSYSVIKWAEIAVANTTNIDESNMAKAMYTYYLAAKDFVDSNS